MARVGLVHGSTQRKQEFHHLPAHVARRWRVIAPLRGRGWTQGHLRLEVIQAASVVVKVARVTRGDRRPAAKNFREEVAEQAAKGRHDEAKDGNDDNGGQVDGSGQHGIAELENEGHQVPCQQPEVGHVVQIGREGRRLLGAACLGRRRYRGGSGCRCILRGPGDALHGIREWGRAVAHRGLEFHHRHGVVAPHAPLGTDGVLVQGDVLVHIAGVGLAVGAQLGRVGVVRHREVEGPCG